MTIVSNDPSWWPLINSNIVLSYWIVAASAVVVYDWILSLGKEIELIWRQCWSLMTLLYLVIRYIGLLYYVLYILRNMPSVSLTDVGCDIIYYVTDGTDVVVSAMLGVIMIARLHAMYQILYQRSRIVLIFLVIIFLAVYIACGVIAAIALKDTVVEELILSGTYICNYRYEADVQLLASVIWMLITLLEVIALCLSVWIAVEHFRDLRRLGASKGSTIGDCFGVLIKSHVLYFASFACVSCFEFGFLSPELLSSNSMEALILYGAVRIFLGVQMFVLGPRLILSVREYHANLLARSNGETSMTSIVLQGHVHGRGSIVVLI